jgi:hypothetical protein
MHKTTALEQRLYYSHLFQYLDYDAGKINIA